MERWSGKDYKMGLPIKPEWGYLIVWEFHVRPGAEERFENVYGPQGDWAQFFKRGEGYAGTELNRDLNIAGRYVTLDFWTSPHAYEHFRELHLAEYKAIDERCEALTERETEIGRFERVSRRT